MSLLDQHHICLTCGFVDTPKNITSGSFMGELAIWIISIVIASVTSWFILLFPFIYSIYRASSTKKGCRSCNSTQIIPVDSPNGKALIDAKSNNVKTE